MDPIALTALLTAVIPVLTAAAKKILPLERIQDERTRAGVKTLLPLILGVVSAGVQAYSQGGDWLTAVTVGLAAGGVGSSVRDVDRNLLGLAEGVTLLFTKKRTSSGGAP